MFFREVMNFIKSLLSSDKMSLSSKRLAGIWLVVIFSFSLIWLVVKDGSNPTVESILNTTVITAAGLLGLDSVTNMFNNHKNDNDNCR